MLTISRPKLQPVDDRSRRDRAVDAGFHVSLGLVGVAIMLLMAFVLFRRA